MFEIAYTLILFQIGVELVQYYMVVRQLQEIPVKN